MVQPRKNVQICMYPAGRMLGQCRSRDTKKNVCSLGFESSKAAQLGEKISRQTQIEPPDEACSLGFECSKAAQLGEKISRQRQIEPADKAFRDD